MRTGLLSATQAGSEAGGALDPSEELCGGLAAGDNVYEVLQVGAQWMSPPSRVVPKPQFLCLKLSFHKYAVLCSP